MAKTRDRRRRRRGPSWGGMRRTSSRKQQKRSGAQRGGGRVNKYHTQDIRLHLWHQRKRKSGDQHILHTAGDRAEDGPTGDHNNKKKFLGLRADKEKGRLRAETYRAQRCEQGHREKWTASVPYAEQKRERKVRVHIPREEIGGFRGVHRIRGQPPREKKGPGGPAIGTRCFARPIRGRIGPGRKGRNEKKSSPGV